jgi:hypothetical protein
MRHVNLEACLEHAFWYTNLNSSPELKQSLTIAVMTGVKNARIHVVSVTVKVVELFARVKDRANGMDNSHIPFIV